jgi:4-diphosphocytidyl-2-C-methyl-D-erythritol kinase
MLCFPNCKINLGLYVTRRRTDGYHDLETIFYPVPLTDVLEIVPAAQTSLHITGTDPGGKAQDNLVWKAWQLIRTDFPALAGNYEIHLHKNIPMGAGMGGGSADGAFMLRLLNDYCRLGLTEEQLIQYALQLGSDCPFFIQNTPQAATGRGEVMTPVPTSLRGYSLQLICPELHIATRDAFAGITPRPSGVQAAELAVQQPEQWRHTLRNDFESTVFAKHPQLAAIKAQLYSQGALYAAMSGTGSTVFGIFPQGHKAVVSCSLPFREVYIAEPL